jgi:hypothetical protein
LCDSCGVVITGIEGMVIREDMIMPQLDMIADYSSVLENPWQRAVAISTSSALTFVSTLPDDPCLFLTFTLLTEDSLRAG